MKKTEKPYNNDLDAQQADLAFIRPIVNNNFQELVNKEESLMHDAQKFAGKIDGLAKKFLPKTDYDRIKDKTQLFSKLKLDFRQRELKEVQHLFAVVEILKSAISPENEDLKERLDVLNSSIADENSLLETEYQKYLKLEKNLKEGKSDQEEVLTKIRDEATKVQAAPQAAVTTNADTTGKKPAPFLAGIQALNQPQAPAQVNKPAPFLAGIQALNNPQAQANKPAATTPQAAPAAKKEESLDDKIEKRKTINSLADFMALYKASYQDLFKVKINKHLTGHDNDHSNHATIEELDNFLKQTNKTAEEVQQIAKKHAKLFAYAKQAEKEVDDEKKEAERKKEAEQNAKRYLEIQQKFADIGKPLASPLQEDTIEATWDEILSVFERYIPIAKQVRKKITEQNKKLEEEIKEVDTIRAQAHGTLAHLKLGVDGAAIKAGQLHVENQDLAGKLTESNQAQLQALKKQYELLQEQIQDQEVQNTRSSANISKLAKQAKEVHGLADHASQAEITHLKTQLTHEQGEIAKLQRAVATVAHHLTSGASADQLEQAQRELTKYKQDLDKANQKADQTLQQIATLTANQAKKHEKINTTNFDCNELIQTLHTVASDLMKQTNSVVEHQRNQSIIPILQQKQQAIMTQKDRLTRQIQHVEQFVEKNQTMLHQDTLSSAKEAIARAHHNIQAAQNEQQNINAQINRRTSSNKG